MWGYIGDRGGRIKQRGDFQKDNKFHIRGEIYKKFQRLLFVFLFSPKKKLTTSCDNCIKPFKATKSHGENLQPSSACNQRCKIIQVLQNSSTTQQAK